MGVSASGSGRVAASGSRGYASGSSGCLPYPFHHITHHHTYPSFTTPPFTTTPLTTHSLSQPPVDRQTPVKTLPCTKLGLRTVKIGKTQLRYIETKAPGIDPEELMSHQRQLDSHV